MIDIATPCRTLVAAIRAMILTQGDFSGKRDLSLSTYSRIEGLYILSLSPLFQSFSCRPRPSTYHLARLRYVVV